jgi:hypothetical protein
MGRQSFKKGPQTPIFGQPRHPSGDLVDSGIAKLAAKGIFGQLRRRSPQFPIGRNQVALIACHKLPRCRLLRPRRLRSAPRAKPLHDPSRKPNPDAWQSQERGQRTDFILGETLRGRKRKNSSRSSNRDAFRLPPLPLKCEEAPRNRQKPGIFMKRKYHGALPWHSGSHRLADEGLGDSRGLPLL